MYYVVPDMKLVTQHRTTDPRKDWSCWHASAQMLIQWRQRHTRSCEARHPDPSQVARWVALYKANPGIVNAQIPDFAADLGLRMVPPMSPTPEAIAGWLGSHGPLWVNGRHHITVVAGIRDTGSQVEVLVFDPAPQYANRVHGEWRSLRAWYALDPVSGRDTSADVTTVFLYVP